MIGKGQDIHVTTTNPNTNLGKITLHPVQLPPILQATGTLTISLSNPACVRLFDAAGELLSPADLTINLSAPAGRLAGLANGDEDIYVEGLTANPDLTITYTYTGTGSGSAVTGSTAIHMAVADLSLVASDGTTVTTIPGGVPEAESTNAASGSPDSQYGDAEDITEAGFTVAISGLHSGQISKLTVSADGGATSDPVQLTDSAAGVLSDSALVLSDTDGGDSMGEDSDGMAPSRLLTGDAEPEGGRPEPLWGDPVAYGPGGVVVVAEVQTNHDKLIYQQAAPWTIHRDPSSDYATAICGGGTVAQLAAKVSLQVADVGHWLTLPGDGMVQVKTAAGIWITKDASELVSTDFIPAGVTASVPNVWIDADLMQGGGLWSRFTSIGGSLGSFFGTDLFTWGYKILKPTTYGALVQDLTSEKGAIWGIVIWAHGSDNGYVGTYKSTPADEGTLWGYQSQITDLLNTQGFKLAHSYAMQCYSFVTTEGGTNYKTLWDGVSIDDHGYYGINGLGIDFGSP